MDIKIRKFEENYIIDVSGEIDLYNAFRLKEVVHGMMEKHICIFILNLKKVSYIDSSGIGALLSINAQLAQEGWRFASSTLRSPSCTSCSSRSSSGFLPIDTTELEAIEAVAGRKRPVR